MRASRRGAGGRVVGVALVAVLGTSQGARAEDLFGNAQIQFQRVESRGSFTKSDGTAGTRRTARELWMQSYDLNHRAYPRENVLVQSTLRLSQLAYTRSGDYAQTPQGSMRLTHPWANLYASYQPSTTRTPLERFAESSGKTGAVGSTTTRTRETQLVGHLTRPSWPQLSLSWIRRGRDALDQVPREQNRQRSARLSYGREHWSTYGSWTDQRFERGSIQPVPMRQRVAGAGGSLQLMPRPETMLSLRYDLTDSRGGFERSRETRNRSHVVDAQGQWSTRKTWIQSVSGNFRRTESTQMRNGSQHDWEGAALSIWQPGPHARVTGGGGVRRVHLLTGDDDLRYLTLIANGDARVRRGWQASGSASSTRNWDPERGDFVVHTLGGSTHYETSRRARLDGNYQIVANGDTASANQRYTISWNAHAQLLPLRSLQAGIALGSFRAGRGVLHPSTVSRTQALDLRWTVLPGTDVNASVSATGLLPHDAPRVVSRSLTLRSALRPSTQFTGTWTRSSQERTSSESAALSGREIVTARLQVSLSRRVAATGGLSIGAPGTDRESRLYDAVMTWSFGR